MAFDKEKFRSYLKPEVEVKEEKIESMPITESIITSIVKPEIIKENIIVEEKKEFSLSQLNLSDNELLELKKVAYAGTIDENVTLSELIDLVLLAKAGKTIQEKNKESLLLKEYIDINNKITIKGKVLLEEDDTKERLREIL